MRQESVVITAEASSLDEVRATCGEHLYPRSMRLVDPSARFSARFAFLHLPRITVADVQYGAEVAGETGELGSYHVNVPLAGRFVASQGGRVITGDTGRAGVYRPVGDNILHTSSADGRLLAVKIDTAALENQLALLLGVPVRGRLRLTEQMDLSEEPGRGFAALVRLIGDECNNPTGLIHQPIVAAPLEECLLMSLLHAVGHQYHDRLLQRGQSLGAQRSVARAIDAVYAEPQRPYTVAGLAEIADVSVSCLHREFHRQVGMSPMAYVREIRLGRVHSDLRDADPDCTSVNVVARKWGFVRPTRFELRYRARYQVTPSETLRRG